MHVRLYQSLLRVSVLVTAAVLLFDGGFVAPITREFSNTTIEYLASVGTSVVANVPQNEVNTLSAELRKRQEELDQREAALASREIETRSFGGGNVDYSTYIISSILFIQLVLIVLNYAMDWSRVRRTRYEQMG